MVKICGKYVMTHIKLGEAYTETLLISFVRDEYTKTKNLWVKWKRMLNRVSKSDMKIQTLLNIVVYPVFEKDGLFDQGVAFQKIVVQDLKSHIKNSKIRDFNIKQPKECPTEENCLSVLSWISGKGVSMDAADLHNFRPDEDKKELNLTDFDTKLDALENYEKELIA
jgi:hypothetical protein